MAYIEGGQRGQHTLFPTTLDELIPQDHVCRVIEAFVGRLDMARLGFVRSEPAETGRPGYDPRDLLKLLSTRHAPSPQSARNALVPHPPRLPPHDASAGTQQSTCNREPSRPGDLSPTMDWPAVNRLRFLRRNWFNSARIAPHELPPVHLYRAASPADRS